MSVAVLNNAEAGVKNISYMLSVGVSGVVYMYIVLCMCRLPVYLILQVLPTCMSYCTGVVYLHVVSCRCCFAVYHMEQVLFTCMLS